MKRRGRKERRGLGHGHSTQRTQGGQHAGTGELHAHPQPREKGLPGVMQGRVCSVLKRLCDARHSHESLSSGQDLPSIVVLQRPSSRAMLLLQLPVHYCKRHTLSISRMRCYGYIPLPDVNVEGAVELIRM